MQKKFFLTIILQLTSVLALFAGPSGRGYDPNAPDLGLPDGNEVFIGLIIAIIAIPIGYAILNASEKENSSDKGFLPSCLGLLFIGGGVVCLLPLIVWICSILSSILAIGFIIFIILAIIGFFISRKK